MAVTGARAGSPACAVARLGPGGPWIGFAPTLDDGYALVVGDGAATRRRQAALDELVALAMVYFEDGLPGPPEDLAATLGDIGALVRHVAEVAPPQPRPVPYQEAVDAIDDGLPADVVLERLARLLSALGEGGEAEDLLRLRAAALSPRETEPKRS